MKLLQRTTLALAFVLAFGAVASGQESHDAPTGPESTAGAPFIRLGLSAAYWCAFAAHENAADDTPPPPAPPGFVFVPGPDPTLRRTDAYRLAAWVDVASLVEVRLSGADAIFHGEESFLSGPSANPTLSTIVKKLEIRVVDLEAIGFAVSSPSGSLGVSLGARYVDSDHHGRVRIDVQDPVLVAFGLGSSPSPPVRLHVEALVPTIGAAASLRMALAERFAIAAEARGRAGWLQAWEHTSTSAGAEGDVRLIVADMVGLFVGYSLEYAELARKSGHVTRRARWLAHGPTAGLTVEF